MRNDMKLIDKDRVVEKINSVLDSFDPNEITSGRYELVNLRDFLDTLEVKEVDCEREINDYISNNFFGSQTLGFFANRTKEEPNDQDIALCAKHFYELGIKTKKGE